MSACCKDAGDILRSHPADVAKTQIRKAIANSQLMLPVTTPVQAAAKARPVTRRMVDCKRETVQWLWEDRIPLGCVSIIGGMPGEGKSTLTCLIAAHVTNGKTWPDGAPNNARGNVIFVTSEDDVGSVTRPRFEDMGGDVERASVLDAVNVGGKELLFNLGDNGLAALEQLLEAEPDTKLIIIDPISAVLGKTDSHRDADVRSLLRPLAELARKHAVAILLVGHLNKSQMGSAMERFGGSIGFVAIARAAHLFVSDPHDKDLRWLVEVKKNVGARQEGLAFRVKSSSQGAAGILEFVDRDDAPTADEALAAISGPPQNRTKSTKVDRAVGWLEAFVANGARTQTEILTAGTHHGFSDKTLRRAKAELGLASKKLGRDGPWAWGEGGQFEDGQFEDGQVACHTDLATFKILNTTPQQMLFTEDSGVESLAAFTGFDDRQCLGHISQSSSVCGGVQ